MHHYDHHDLLHRFVYINSHLLYPDDQKQSDRLHVRRRKCAGSALFGLAFPFCFKACNNYCIVYLVVEDQDNVLWIFSTTRWLVFGIENEIADSILSVLKFTKNSLQNDYIL